MIKKLMMMFMCVVLSVCMLSFSSNAIYYTINVRDNYGFSLYGASIDVRSSDYSNTFPVSGDSLMFDFEVGDQIGFNVRKSGYHVSTLNTKTTIPNYEDSITYYLTPNTAFMNYGYTAPFASYLISSRMGWRAYSDDFGVWHFDWHTGIDIPHESGDYVMSICDSEDFYDCFDNNRGYYTSMLSPDGYRIYYMHLREAPNLSSLYTEISQGDQIGRVGNTGASGGVHLHLDISYNNDYYDPEAFF